jgi:DNA helicase-2/ATP-dependent DNA helicase PcrA
MELIATPKATLKPTREQKLIINHLRGHAMVTAGPGCAKTSTLALRVMYMLDQGCEPTSIVILTYGKELASDIAETLSKLVGTDAQQVTVATIHSFACRLLKMNYQSLGQAVPRALKQQRKKRLIKRLAKRTGLTVGVLKQVFNQYDEDAYSGTTNAKSFPLDKDKAELARWAYKQYSRDKIRRNTVDFNDMVGDALKLLKATPDSTLLHYQHLMVDELQDVDGVQKEFLLQLARRMKSTVMVGDPLQLIYGWRRAHPRYWNDIETALSPQKFELTRSFRIPRQALALVNDLGSRINEDAPVLTSQFEGKIPKLLEFADQDQQHRYVAKEIKRLITRGVGLNKIAILGKTRKELGQSALGLRARGILVTERYRSKDNNRHKTHLLALIQLTRLEQIRVGRSSKALDGEELSLAWSYIDSLWLPRKLRDLLQNRLMIKPKAVLSEDSKSQYYNRINDLSKAVKKAAVLALNNIESAIQCLIDASKPVLKDRNGESHKLLLRDLSEIKIKSRNCMTMDDIEDDWFEPTTVDEGVQLMTCHGAKGQEWDYVFIINVVEGIFPRYQYTEAKAEEENRVFYVAATRHHKKLYVLQTPTPARIVTKKSCSGARSCSPKPVIFDKPSSFIDIANQGLVYKNYA